MMGNQVPSIPNEGSALAAFAILISLLIVISQRREEDHGVTTADDLDTPKTAAGSCIGNPQTGNQ